MSSVFGKRLKCSATVYLRYVGSPFRARGVAIDKALAADPRLVRGIVKSPFTDACEGRMKPVNIGSGRQ